MAKTKKIKIPKELKKYYSKTIEEAMDEHMNFENFVNYIMLLRRHKKMTFGDVVKSIEHYCADYDGENCHDTCICEATGKDFSRLGLCPDSEH